MAQPLAIDVGLIVGASISPDVKSQNKFGRNPDIDSSTTPEDIWRGGGLYPFPLAPQILQIASDNANDTAAGTGARTVRISGLCDNWLFQDEDVTLNGTGTVESTLPFVRVFRVKVLTAGTRKINEGTITITYKDDATTAALVGPDEGQTLLAIYTVPAGYTAFMTRIYATLNSSLNNAAGSRASVGMFFRENDFSADASWNLKHEESIVIDGTSHMLKEYLPYLKIPQKTDIRITAISVSDNNTDIDAGFDLILLSNDYLRTLPFNS